MGGRRKQCDQGAGELARPFLVPGARAILRGTGAVVR